MPPKKGLKKSLIKYLEKPKFSKYLKVDFSSVLKIASIDFFFRKKVSFNILILSENVPIEENKVGNNKEKERKGSPIV
ncbi:MAG: Uncharacterised protein [Polaribacter sp. SA4-10]|nr:MAG: Uncharacterised protein [Polaribacter sp. SA4-10]